MSVVVAPIHRLLSNLPVLSKCHTFVLYESQPSTQRRPLESQISSPSCILHLQWPSLPCFLKIWTTLPSPPANTCSYIICRISNGSLDKKEDVDWSSVLCRDLRMLEDIPSIESKGGRGLVSARLRLRGRGSIAGSPLARLASSCISGGLRILDAKWSSYIRRVHMIGAMQIIIRNILYTSTRDFGLRHRKISVVLIATR
jgi:hypothetical protein